MDPRPQRGGGRLRRRGGGTSDRPARRLRGQLWAREHAPDPGAVRRPPGRCARARDRLTHPDGADRDVVLPGDSSGATLRRVQSLLRAGEPGVADATPGTRDRKSTRLNSSHRCISYAVFCLKKKKKKNTINV